MLWVFQKSPKITKPNHPQLPYLPKTMNEKKRKLLKILNLSLFRFPDSELQDFPNRSMRSTSWAQDTQGNTRHEKYGFSFVQTKNQGKSFIRNREKITDTNLPQTVKKNQNPLGNMGKWRENFGFCWPNPQIKPALMILVFTGCRVKQSQYHFHECAIRLLPILSKLHHKFIM